MSRKAVFPGSFDPFTLGHEDIVRRALPLFDELVIAIGHNSSKTYMFPLESRKQAIERLFESVENVSVDSYEGLTVDYCKACGAGYIVRGIRTASDAEFERNIAQMNKALEKEIETVFLTSRPDLSAINSTIVRDIIRNGGDASRFVPEGIELS